MYQKYTRKIGIPRLLYHKIMLIMRLITVILIASLLQVSAAGFAQRITLNKSNETIQSIFKAIKTQSGYNFFYTDNLLKGAKLVNISVKGAELDDVLALVFADQPFEYEIKNNTVIVVKKETSIFESTIMALRAIEISGLILDENGKPLPAALVKVKGSSKGAVATESGRFSLSGVNKGDILVISYIGYKTQEVIVGDSRSITVTLETAESTLDEVSIVVGYGVQKRVHMTGAVSQISAKELMKAPMQNVSNMLTGKLPGLTSIQSSGKPGADGTALYVRGLNSFAGNNGPMILVDGVPRPIDYVNPNDIESVSVLKDAAAAIYGIQGANGVILITTKKGSVGPAKIFYDGSMTMTENTAMPEMLNAADYMYWHNKARMMDNLTPVWTADIQNKVMSNDPNNIWGETDWLKKIFRTGQTAQHNISASGGTEKTKYFTSLGIMNQEGTLINTGLKRYNLRTNLDIEVAKNLKFTTNLSGHRSDRAWPGTDISNQGEFNPIRQAINTIPLIKDEFNGLPTAWKGATYNMNGYASSTESGYLRQTRWNFDSNAKLEYDFAGLTDVLKNLRVSIFGSYNYGNTVDSQYARYYELYTVNPTFDEGVAGASGFSPANTYSKSASWGDSYLWRPQIEYTREFGKHYVGAMALFEAKQSYSNTMTGTKQGYYSDEPVDLSLGSTFPTTPVTGSHVYSGGQTSYVGRLNYAYSEKYLAEMAFRYDGSYIFAPGNQWGFFPSASVGWVVSKEDFFSQALPQVDYLKLRASFGKTGNDAVDPFQHNSLFALASNSMVLGNQALSQFYSINPYLYTNLTWSSTDSYNLGMDLDMWNRKLGIEVNVFYKLTKDILESQGGNYPTSLGGYYPTFKNSGRVENKGFEVSLKHFNQINSDWSYNVRADFAFARNKVLSRIVSDNRPNYRSAIGESMGARYGFNAIGLFQSQEEIDHYPTAPSGFLRPGDLKYQDVNGDGIISSNYDYVKMGYGAVPEINFALNMDVSYKGFYASMLWQGVTHADYELSGAYDSGVISSTVYTSTFAENGNSPYYRIENAWTPENTNAQYPRLTTVSNGNNAWQSTWWLVNGEYLRLKNANIGYNLPAKLLKKTPFSRANIYMAGTNLLTFSHFKYIDPESPSVSNGYYPQQKTYSLGLNITF
jgi:TonB-linked SusC/RagA family outer membrane protein